MSKVQPKAADVIAVINAASDVLETRHVEFGQRFTDTLVALLREEASAASEHLTTEVDDDEHDDEDVLCNSELHAYEVSLAILGK